MMTRLKRTLPVLTLIALTLIGYAHLAFTDRILARGDTLGYFYPYWTLRSEAFRAGELPLWSPDLFMGVPLLANSQIGTFYPPNWIVTPFDAPIAIKISLLIHVAWAGIGAYALARRALQLDRAAALAAGAVFMLGGFTGAHVEQINQLQGISWMSWLFLLLDQAITPHPPTPSLPKGWRAFVSEKHLRMTILLGAAIALQFFTGHTQTVFISGVGLAIYGLARRGIRGLIPLIGAGVVAVLLSLPQLIPTLELTSLSSRSGGLNRDEATAFSFSPLDVLRLFPSYSEIRYGEDIAYLGIIGAVLALIGAVRRRAWVWIGLALIGLFLAVGRYNPAYYLGIAALPGFNLFRVPARWLMLFALGGSMLAGIGFSVVKTWLTTHHPLPTQAGKEGTAFPFAPLHLRAFALMPYVLFAFVCADLLLANRALPHSLTVPHEAWDAERFTISQLQVLIDDEPIPPRVLSISGGFFDPGDVGTLTARYQAWGMNAEEIRLALVALKHKELVVPNINAAWGIPSADGFDGGLLPTRWYAEYTEQFLPADQAMLDGRLRELLAQESCRGACVPPAEILAAMDVRYVILDKVYDVWHEEIAYDTGIPITGSANYHNVQAFPADVVDVVTNSPDVIPFVVDAEAEGQPLELPNSGSPPLYRVRYRLGDSGAVPDRVRVSVDSGVTIWAVTLVNTNSGTFQQLAPYPFQRILSSDVKIYALEGLRERVSIAFDAPQYSVIAYSDTRIDLRIPTRHGGTVILRDAYYPGWVATYNGDSVPLERYDTMFRAVTIPEGCGELVIEYRPAWLIPTLIGGGVLWLIVIGYLFLASRRRMLGHQTPS